MSDAQVPPEVEAALEEAEHFISHNYRASMDTAPWREVLDRIRRALGNREKPPSDSGDTVRDVDREGFIPIPFKQIVVEWEALKVEAASLRERLAEAERDREVMHAALRLAAAERDTLRAALEETLALHTTKDEYGDPEGGSGFYCAECGSTAEECPTEAIARRALGTGTQVHSNP